MQELAEAASTSLEEILSRALSLYAEVVEGQKKGLILLTAMISREQAKLLEDLRTCSKAESFADLLMNALNVYKFICDNDAEGARFLREKDGETSVVVWPGLYDRWFIA